MHLQFCSGENSAHKRAASCRLAKIELKEVQQIKALIKVSDYNSGQ